MEWEQRVTEVWARFDEVPEEDFPALVESAVEGAPPAVAAFELAGAFDSTGHPDRAVPLYREALDLGLTGEHRRRAVIQLASSLRNLGQPEVAVDLLTAERDAGSDDLDDAVRAFLALALVDVGREREAVSLALGALAPHLPRYQRSLRDYARELLG
ncbi:tetratricopeptide repeat protein [Saccharothrix australiensis]|uniref:Tetratricopeptide repeat protein n=1 Tax=Saccharothrix australiensis TaxID=2072 RepID=A0A495W3C9_9PSEU|nr:tetratricopeptide repeat protein [Saccharothrix australiensis]RKT56172.1 tetratricopeptide repeat protein [Saccharothrix australiensis]